MSRNTNTTPRWGDIVSDEPITMAGPDSPTGDTPEALIHTQATENQHLTMISLARIASSAEGLTGEVKTLNASYVADKEETRRDRHRYAVGTTLGLVTLALLLLILFNQARANHASLAQVATTQRQARANAQQIVDCTTPQGKCFRAGQAKSGAIIGDPPAPINSVTLWTSVCARRIVNPARLTPVQLYNEIHMCVVAGVAKGSHP